MATANGVTNYFADAANGNDSNDGLDNTGFGATNCTWDETNKRLTSSGASFPAFATGMLCYVVSGTGVLQAGLYEVTATNGPAGTTIDLAATSDLPGVLDANDLAAADSSTGDWILSDGPVATFNACTDLCNGDGDYAWIRSGTTYTDTSDLGGALSTHGADDQVPVTVEGYTTTIGDNGVATISVSGGDGISVPEAGEWFWIFRNLRFTTCTIAVDGSTSADYLEFVNCEFDNCTSGGLRGNNNFLLVNCSVHDNSGWGLECDTGCRVYGCAFYNNTSGGVKCQVGGQFSHNIFYGNNNGTTGTEVFIENFGSSYNILDGNTFDAENSDISGVSSCYDADAGRQSFIFAFNNIFYDADNGILNGTGPTRNFIDYNLYEDVTTPRTNVSDRNTTITTDDRAGDNEIEDVTTLFTNPATPDYSLATNSEAEGEGLDAGGHTAGGGTSYRSIGAVQKDSSGGGGGTTVPQTLHPIGSGIQA